MKHWLQKIKACNLQNNRRAIEQWAWIRGGGRARFIIRTTLVYSLAIMIIQELTEGRMVLSNIISAHLGGLMLGLFLCWSMERRYKKAYLRASVNIAPTSNPKNVTDQ